MMKCAFRYLKKRFRSLLTLLDFSEHNILFVVVACCVFHSLCESKEAFLPRSGAEA